MRARERVRACVKGGGGGGGDKRGKKVGAQAWSEKVEKLRRDVGRYGLYTDAMCEVEPDERGRRAGDRSFVKVLDGVVRAGRQGGRQLSGSRGGPGLLFVICMSNSDAVGRIRRSSRADVRLTNLCSAGVPRGTESFCLSDI